MQELIKKSLSDLLDNLLKHALEEKPDYADEYTINYSNLNLKIETYNVLIHLVKNDFNCSGSWLHYPYDLTDNQKELINKIFQRWGDNANTKRFYNYKKKLDLFFMKINKNSALNDLEDKKLNYKCFYRMTEKNIALDIYKSNNTIYSNKSFTTSYMIDLQYLNGNTIEHFFYITTIERINQYKYKDIIELIKSECIFFLSGDNYD